VKKIGWDKNCYYIDGKPVFLACGEFHYFRVPRKDWRKRLELWKETGGNCVATYIPWILHEPVEGDFRFGDIPERDLEGFLTLCAEMDLFAIVRPGPYVYSEIVHAGLPPWLIENYPDLLLQAIDGRTFPESGVVSYLHPLFLEKAKKWYDKICPVIAKYCLSRGGPIAFAQVDNELAGIQIWLSGGYDYNREAMGIGREGGRYPCYLENKYRTVEAMNRAYSTDFAFFAAAEPFAGSPAEDGQRRRVKDYEDFYFTAIGEYALTLSGWMDSYGIDCDIVHNSPNPDSNTWVTETAAAFIKKGKPFLLGSDHYYTLNQDWAQNNPTPQYGVRMFYSFEILRLMGYPPSVFEMPGGSPSDWPPIQKEDLECCYFLNLAMGMKGFNYYVFTGGPNPLGIGATGEIYDYNCSVSATGEIRPTFEAQKNFGLFLKENSWLAAAERHVDFHIGYVKAYTRSAKWFGSEKKRFSNSAAWEFVRKGLIPCAFGSSLSPALADLESREFLEDLSKPLYIASAASMPAGAQKKAAEFLRLGGKIIIGPVFPELDEELNPCTILRDAAGAGPSGKLIAPWPLINTTGGSPVSGVMIETPLYQSPAPQGAETIAVLNPSAAHYGAPGGSPVGWYKGYESGGALIYLGAWFSYGLLTQGAMLRSFLFRLAGTKPLVECDNPNIWTSLFRSGDKSALFVINHYSSRARASVKIEKDRRVCFEKRDLILEPMEVKRIVVDQ
jgi:beta-galactosidase